MASVRAAAAAAAAAVQRLSYFFSSFFFFLSKNQVIILILRSLVFHTRFVQRKKKIHIVFFVLLNHRIAFS